MSFLIYFKMIFKTLEISLLFICESFSFLLRLIWGQFSYWSNWLEMNVSETVEIVLILKLAFIIVRMVDDLDIDNKETELLEPELIALKMADLVALNMINGLVVQREFIVFTNDNALSDEDILYESMQVYQKSFSIKICQVAKASDANQEWKLHFEFEEL